MSKVKRQQLGKMFETVPQETAVFSTEKRPDRAGKRATLFQIPEAAKKQLAFLAIESDTTQQALLTEALNMLFSKYGKPPIA
jgi:hypothetical protein